MDERYICYCGLYCGNCIIKARIVPAAEKLLGEMRKAGFEGIIQFIPGGDGFWQFLKDTAENRMFITCREGCGDPGCAIRMCAKEKNIDVCALCESYPCEHLAGILKKHPLMAQDNLLIKEKGMEAWAKLQDERRAKGFVFGEQKQ
jgi:hypothetical protein